MKIMWEYNYFSSDELYHYGVKGMKWGIRRYQNPDGSLTEAGRRREAKKYTKQLNKTEKKRVKNLYRAYDYQYYLNNARDAYLIDLLTYGGINNPSARRTEKFHKAKASANKLMKEYLDKGNEHADEARRCKKVVSDIIKELTSKGYTISSEDKREDTIYEAKTNYQLKNKNGDIVYETEPEMKRIGIDYKKYKVNPNK